MTTLFTNEYEKAYESAPKTSLLPHERDGRIRRITAQITLSQEIDTTDKVVIAKLPANAVISSFKMEAPGGSSGVLQVGWAAGADANEAADLDGILPAIAANAAVALEMGIFNQQAAYNKRFSEAVDIELSATTISAGWSGDVVDFEILYVID